MGHLNKGICTYTLIIHMQCLYSLRLSIDVVAFFFCKHIIEMCMHHIIENNLFCLCAHMQLHIKYLCCGETLTREINLEV